MLHVSATFSGSPALSVATYGPPSISPVCDGWCWMPIVSSADANAHGRPVSSGGGAGCDTARAQGAAAGAVVLVAGGGSGEEWGDVGRPSSTTSVHAQTGSTALATYWTTVGARYATPLPLADAVAASASSGWPVPPTWMLQMSVVVGGQ